MIKDKITRTLKAEPLEKRVAPFGIVSESESIGTDQGTSATGGPTVSDCPGQGGSAGEKGPVDVQQ